MCLIALLCVCLGLQLLQVLTNSVLIQSHEVGMRIILIFVLWNGGSSGAKVTCSKMHGLKLLMEKQDWNPGALFSRAHATAPYTRAL